MKLSKQDIKKQNTINKLLNLDRTLTIDERVFIYKNFNEGAITEVGYSGTFFTPFNLARDFHLDIPVMGNSRIIDLCAGIGTLSFHLLWYCQESYAPKEIVCVERNPDFVEIGKKLLPEATWICADILDEEFIKSLGQFDAAYSNPPYGRIKSLTDSSWLHYKGSEFEYKAAEICARLAPMGTLLIPQQSAPFRLSASPSYQQKSSSKHSKFLEQTRLILSAGTGVDTSLYTNEWKHTNILTEIVCYSKEDQILNGDLEFKPDADFREEQLAKQTQQLELF